MFDPTPLITDRARAVDASGIRRVFDLASKVANPINLSIGQPDFDVPQAIKDAAIAAIQSGHNSYTPTQGIPALHEEIRKEYDARFATNGLWNDYGLLITSGVSGSLSLALLACAQGGDEVLIPDPYFVMYKQLTRLVGATPICIDTYPDFKLTAERVEPMITDRTKLLLVSSPSNPTGVCLTDREWADLVALCESRGILLVSDEIYDIFTYDPVQTAIGPRCPSPASHGENVLILRGFSKSWAMTGWRLGYAAGPKPIIEQMTKLQQYTFVCAPSMVQQAGIAAMDVDMLSKVALYQQKRDRVVERLADHFDLVTPTGAFYAFPKAPNGLTGAAFVEKAIEHNVLMIPGNVFSDRDTHFRISYACADETLERGLDILIKLANS